MIHPDHDRPQQGLLLVWELWQQTLQLEGAFKQKQPRLQGHHNVLWRLPEIRAPALVVTGVLMHYSPTCPSLVHPSASYY